MTRIIPALTVLALLAACGADGKPIAPAKPTPQATSTGVTITGDGRFGVTSGNRDGGSGGGGSSGGGSTY